MAEPDFATLTLTVEVNEALEDMRERPIIGEMAVKMLAWAGEFGELDLMTAYTVAMVTLLKRRRDRAGRDGRAGEG